MSGGAYVLIFDGLSDWEPAHALAELRRSGGMEVVSVGFTSEPITTMGGLRILPDTTLDAVDPVDMRILILPGGELWETAGPPDAVLELLGRAEAAGVPIAAICAATIAAARAGLLAARRHTSNGRDYLVAAAPAYAGADHYVEDALAVRDRGVITASGVGSVEFAREIMAELDVLDEASRAVWFDLFKHGVLPEPA